MRSRTQRRALLGVVLLLSSMPVLSVQVGAEPTPPGPITVSVSTVIWAPCPTPEASPVPVECATLPVPLDYGRPDGRQIPLALYRTKAPTHGTAANRGSLVVNPGGPGAGGRDFVVDVAMSLPPAVTEVYDIVGFDPRGVEASDGLRCGIGAQFPYALDGDPVGDQLAAAAELGAACAAQDAELLAAMGTANVARDLERIRSSLGDARLNFLGFSYGTRIGTVYAELHPERVGRFVLDGVMDPAASYRSSIIDQMAGFEDSLQRFFAACDAVADCAFNASQPGAGTAFGSTRANFEALLQRARTEGLPVGPLARRTLDLQDFATAFPPYLYQGHHAFAALAEALAHAAAGDATELAAVVDETGTRPLGTYFAVTCADADAIDGRAEANFATWSLRQRAPIMAPATREIVTCGAFPVAREPVPALTRRDLPGALLVSTTHDPATPYAGAVALAQAWPGSRLASFEGDGHTVALDGVRCVDAAVVAFLLDGALPEGGTRCRPDRLLGIRIASALAGTVVVQLDPTGAAAGLLQPGDVLTALDGVPFADAALSRAIADGAPFRLTIRRGTESLEVVLQSALPTYWRP